MKKVDTNPLIADLNRIPLSILDTYSNDPGEMLCIVVNKAKSAAIENELEGNKQNSCLLWKALKKLSLSGKVKSAMPNDFNASRRGRGGGGVGSSKSI